MLDPATHALFTDATVQFLLAARAQFLKTGASPLTHWSQMTTRLQLTPQTCTSVEEMTSRYLRDLRIEAPSRDSSSAMEELRRVVAENGGAVAWLDFVEREAAFLIARARNLADERRDLRLAEAAAQATPLVAHD